MSDITTPDTLRFRHIVVELGFVTAAQVDEALAVQEELHASGVATHLGDVLCDLGFLSDEQRHQVLLQQDMRLTLESLPAGRKRRSATWVVAGLLPVALIPSTLGVLACAAAILLGAAAARARPFRWLAVGWLAATAVPGTPLAVVAGAGALGETWGAHLRSAGLVAATSVLPALDVRPTPGALFLLAACALAIAWRWRP